MLANADERTDNGLDSGPRAGRAQPVRRCALSRAELPAAQMVRFVVDPAGQVVPDIKKKLPGRGLWLEGRRDTLRKALQKGTFSRGFGSSVVVPPNLAERTEDLLVAAACDALAMAGKAGAAVAGFSRVEKAATTGGILALIHAAEAGEDGRRKLAGALRAAGGSGVPVIESFTSAQLDLALARPNVVHAAVLDAPAGHAFLARFRRLADFRSESDLGSPESDRGPGSIERPGKAASATEQD